MTLAIIESYSDGITSPSAMPVSTRIPGPVGRPRQLHRARRRGEAALRVLRVDAGLDRVPARRRRIPLEPAARRDVELQLDQVEAGRRLGHRVLHLEARVDLEEGKRSAPAAGRGTRRCRRCGTRPPAQVDRAPRRSASPAPRPAPATPTPRSASGCAAGPSSRARRPPRRSVVVGDHLHLDVARAGHEPLHQHARVTERPPGLGARPLEGGGSSASDFTRRIPRPPPTGGRLDHQREADRRRVRQRVRDRSPPGRGSTRRPVPRPPRRAAWPRSCRRGAASRRRAGR